MFFAYLGTVDILTAYLKLFINNVLVYWMNMPNLLRIKSGYHYSALQQPV